MKSLLILLLASCLASVSYASPLILQPEISPDGNTIAFSYQGDIWTVPVSGGRAFRLTIHEGYESSPVWSDNSQQIAFNSDRFGNNDVFVIDAQGGRPTRLSYHSASDRVTDITPSNDVLFMSRRLYQQVERESEVLVVDIDGKRTESRFMDGLGMDAVVSPDGNKVAFVRSTARVSREDYRGPANRNIWIYNTRNNNYAQLTNFAGSDFMPKWIDNSTLYYVSPQSGKYNVHKIDLSGTSQALTNETAFGVNHFSTNANGSIIVYQTGDKVFLFDVAANKKQRINIDVSSDFRFDPQVTQTKTNDIDEYAVSPNGKLSAYVLRGDIFVTRNDKDDKRSVRVTTGAARDQHVKWLNDSTLIYVSDTAGQKDLYTLMSDDDQQTSLFYSLKYKAARITDTEEDETSPVISPNGKRIAFLRGRGQLHTANISETGALSEIKTLLDGWDTPEGIVWSPDSQWLAYSLSDLNFNEEIYIHAADNSKAPVNVSMHPKYDVNPVFSPDGSKLGFSSMRNNGDFDIWFVWLNEADWQRSKAQWQRAEFKDDSNDKPSSNESDEKDENEEAESETLLSIDFDGIYKRLEQVTRFAGNELELAFDKEGEHIYYSIGGNTRQNFKIERQLHKIKWDGEDKETILSGDAQASDLYLTNNGKHLYALTKGGKLVRVITKTDKNETLTVSSTLTIDHQQELTQIFDDAWRALNAGFYDPNFHGKDWQKLREQYRPIALKASTKEDFQYIFNLMLGQVNASHMGLFRGENPKQTQKQTTGLLGIEGKHTDKGFEISSVLKNSPAYRQESKLQVGDIITAVNQQTLDNTNLYRLLMNKVDEPVLLSVRSKKTTHEIEIWPVSSLRSETYDAWVDERKRLTDEYSDGRLGYLHIRGMNWSSFERFERELMAAGYGKDGIVIDVRYNGGGWTTDYLMAVLNVKQHAYTIPRGAAENLQSEHTKFRDTYPFSERLPLSSWTKPSIAMSNENSYSNAEIFSHAYKALGIGKLVGRPTFGAVISTGGYRLVDGSLLRMPFRGWWVKETGENMDFVPATPDIEVFNPPAYKAKGVDPQLKRAVSELVNSL
ncbi:MAG: S41 family peptidase [Glaciecola sp.]